MKQKMSENETSADSWDGLLSNYLKAENLEAQEEILVCIGLNVKEKDMDLQIERLGKKYLFGMNITNKVFLKTNGIDAPKDVIGKKLTFTKVKATNPNTHKEVDSLRITKVE